jgi:hypothetical protein
LGFDGASAAGRRGVVGGLSLAFVIGFIAILTNFFVREGESTGAGNLPERPTVAAPVVPHEPPVVVPREPPVVVVPQEPPVEPAAVGNLKIESDDPNEQNNIHDEGSTTVVESGTQHWVLSGDITGEPTPDYQLFVLNRNQDPVNGDIEGKHGQVYRKGETKEYYVQGEIPDPRVGHFRFPVRLGAEGCGFGPRPRIMTVVLAHGETLQFLRERRPDNEMIPLRDWEEMATIPVRKDVGFWTRLGNHCI